MYISFQNISYLGTYAKKIRLAIYSVILIHFPMFFVIDRPKHFVLVIVEHKKNDKSVIKLK